MTQCRLCSSTNVHLVFPLTTEWGEFEIFRCTECSAEFIDPSVEVDDKAIQAHFFDSNPYTENRQGVLDRYWRNEASHILSLKPDGGSILDIGCNSGDFLSVLDSRWEKFGVELAPAPAEQARKHGITIYDKPIEECSFKNQRFDVVTMFALIEHLRYPEETVATISNVLKPGGLLVIMTGDASAFKSRFLGKKWHMYIPPLHRYFFTRQSLKQLCEQFDLQEKSHRYTSGGMTFSKNRVLRILEKATLWQLSTLPALQQVPFYDHYYGYFVKQR